MSRDPADVLTPRILLVDDERQIHASVRLRIGRDYDLVCCTDARQALETLQHQRFDLCFADIHMPHMDGLTFIERAREVDPALGYVILSAFDSGENLRRAIPLQVFDFIGKPLPERDGFERRIPEWVERTRRQRRDSLLAQKSHHVAQELASAQLAHEVEIVASESARDALLQTANLLTTIHAHLVAATSFVSPRARQDSSLSQLLRNLEAARGTAEAAVSVADGFFNSAYANRSSAPALLDAGTRHAIDIARRLNHADEANKAVDFSGCDLRATAREISGIDFLLMMVPVVAAALTCATPNSTVRIESAVLPRLDAALKHPNAKDLVWLNRRNGLLAQPGIQFAVTASAPALERAEVEAWLAGQSMRLATVAPRGLIAGLQKSGGMFGIGTPPTHRDFSVLLVLPAQ